MTNTRRAKKSKPSQTTNRPSHIAVSSVPKASDFIYDPDKGLVDDAAPIARNVPRLRNKIITIICLFGLLFATYFGLRILDLKRVFVKNTNAAPVELEKKINTTAITTEAADRINVLLLGVGDGSHAGADLSDSMMVLSVDPHSYDGAIISLPRDLYVKIGKNTYDKINTAHSIGERDNDGGPALAKETVSQTLGVPIHYFVRTDFSGLKKAIDTLGGISVNVETALSDSEYPCEANEGRVCGFSIKSGTQILKGDLALKYARCRKGNCGNDFGRAHRQQQVLLAMRAKALSLNTLVNPAKLADLTNIVGGHVKTDISLDEMKTLYNVLKQVQPGSTTTTVLDNTVNNLVTTSNVGGLSVVIPSAGNGNYSQIQRFVRQLFFDGYIKKENVSLAVENATGNPTRKQALCDYLKSFRYNVVSCTNTTKTQTKSSLFAQNEVENPYTLQYLRKRFSVGEVQKSTTNSTQTAQLRLVIGSEYKGE